MVSGRATLDSLSLGLAAVGGLPLGPGRGDGCSGSRGARRLASWSMRTAYRCLVLAALALVTLMGRESRRVGFISSLLRPAEGVKQTYPRVGAVSHLAAATTCGHG